jgi:hypothetical protein
MRRGTALVFGIVMASTLAACGGDSNDAQATRSTAGPTAATASTGPSGDPATGPTSPTGTTDGTATGATSTGPDGSTGLATDLEDGRYFGYIEEIQPPPALLFDLAYFYTGDEANRIAAERGDDTPGPNDYSIANHTPTLRAISMAHDTDIEVFDWNRCCDERVSIDYSTFATAISSPEGVDLDGHRFNGPGSPYWITLDNGVITKIEEQFLP